MTRAEAAQLLAFLMAPYQGEPLEADGVEVWWHSAQLANRDFTTAMGVARDVVAVSEFRPTPAAFNGVWRQRAQQPPPVSDLPALAPAPRGHASEMFEMLAEVLAKADKRDHWHGGPDPCPVCGGLQPPSGKSKRRAVLIEKEWCSRCGEQSMSHSAALAPVEVDPMVLPDPIPKPKKESFRAVTG